VGACFIKALLLVSILAPLRRPPCWEAESRSEKFPLPAECPATELTTAPSSNPHACSGQGILRGTFQYYIQLTAIGNNHIEQKEAKKMYKNN
jgi:hypothetical protein